MQNSLLHTTGIVASFCLIAAGGVAHGLMTNRWDRPNESKVIAERFESFPRRVGEWELKSTNEMSAKTLKMLECDGYLTRTYVNGVTRETVTVAVLLGPPGPMGVHTPEICYSSHKYSIEQPRQAAEFTGTDGESDELWRLTLRSRDLHSHRLRVYYGWSTDGTWQATASPRFSFAGDPFLVKLQIAGQVSRADDSTTPDPCLSFLEEFTPQLRRHLFAASQSDEGT